jgi:hypothetical protein
MQLEVGKTYKSGEGVVYTILRKSEVEGMKYPFVARSRSGVLISFAPDGAYIVGKDSRRNLVEAVDAET